MQGFANLIGQKRAQKILKESIKHERVSHAYLFIGAEGTGKRSLALAFAAALNCLSPEPPCGSCRNCRRVLAGNHPDVTILEPEGKSFKIAQIRRLQQLISLKPYEGGWKIFIIDGVETFTEQAANSLLKTLEEPPVHSVLILLANTALLLPTITSRCTIVPLQPLSDHLIRQILEEKGYAEAERIAAISGGSLGKAFQIAADWPELIEPVTMFLQVVTQDQAWMVDSSIYTRFKEDLDFRELFLDFCEAEYKQGIIVQSQVGLAGLEIIGDAREQLRSNVNPEGVLRTLAIKLARLQRRAV